MAPATRLISLLINIPRPISILHKPLTRKFHVMPAQQLLPKGPMTKDDMNTETYENSGSGTDNDAAAQDEVAFNPGKTKPEDELQEAKKANDSKHQNSPLDVSGANPDVSKTQSGTEGGPENSPKAGGGLRSRHGSPNKGHKRCVE